VFFFGFLNDGQLRGDFQKLLALHRLTQRTAKPEHNKGKVTVVKAKLKNAKAFGKSVRNLKQLTLSEITKPRAEHPNRSSVNKKTSRQLSFPESRARAHAKLKREKEAIAPHAGELQHPLSLTRTPPERKSGEMLEVARSQPTPIPIHRYSPAGRSALEKDFYFG